MAEKLKFSLVSPQSELLSGEVDQVDVPGSEGDFGVFPGHAPFMAAIRTGTITVFNDGSETKYLIEGGFADVTPDGLTVLAESATLLADVDPDYIDREISKAESRFAEITDDTRLDVAQHLDGLKRVQANL